MAIYRFYRESIYEYYKQIGDFLLTSRVNPENEHINCALNMDLILSSACYVEGFMEKEAKCVLGYYRLVYNAIDIPEFELRKPMNTFFRRIEADIYQRISQGTGVDNYDRLFELVLGHSFKQDVSFHALIEPIQVLFQLRNVIAHAKEISVYEVSAYWNNNVFEENFYGGYKRAEEFLIKNGLLKERYIETQNVELFFTNAIADFFYNISQQFTQKLHIFLESNMEQGEILNDELKKFNKVNNTEYSFMDFCELNAHAIRK